MKEQLLELLENKEYIKLRDLLIEMNHVNIAEILEELDTNNQLVIFRILPKDTAVLVFSYLSTDTQEAIIHAITDKEVKTLIDELYFDDMIDLLEEMPANIVKKIIRNVSEEERSLVNQFLKYPENSAGSLMTIEYVDLKRDITVKDALQKIKRIGLEKETVYTCYVIDQNRKLEGIVSLRELVVSPDDTLISDLMTTDVIYVHTNDDQEEIAKVFKKYGFLALPVVDTEKRLVGIITFDDIMKVIEEESTEDIYKMAAIVPSEETYMSSSIFHLARNRITWLLFLMISATFTGYIIRNYEATLSSQVILASFIPMLMDTAGNAGSQASTLIIRGLSLGEVKIKDIFKIIFKEFRISLIVGLILSSINLIRILIVDKTSFSIALTVSLSLYLTIVFAKVFGGMLPIIASKLKLDPAIMASPIITTIVDAISLLFYFQLASLILGI